MISIFAFGTIGQYGKLLPALLFSLDSWPLFSSRRLSPVDATIIPYEDQTKEVRQR